MRHGEHWSRWYPGSEREWRALPHQEQEDLAFYSTGCLYAYPTWGRTHCVHVTCQIRRGELPRIAHTNVILRGEAKHGYLRFLRDGDARQRQSLAQIYRWFRRQARTSGIYDPWKVEGGWQIMVSAALSV